MKKKTNKRKSLDARIIKEAKYFINNKSTVRATAKHFKMSKSVVWQDISRRLPVINAQLYMKCREILSTNARECTSRGGQATKYQWAHNREVMKQKVESTINRRRQNEWKSLEDEINEHYYTD